MLTATLLTLWFIPAAADLVLDPQPHLNPQAQDAKGAKDSQEAAEDDDAEDDPANAARPAPDRGPWTPEAPMLADKYTAALAGGMAAGVSVAGYLMIVSLLLSPLTAPLAWLLAGALGAGAGAASWAITRFVQKKKAPLGPFMLGGVVSLFLAALGLSAVEILGSLGTTVATVGVLMTSLMVMVVMSLPTSYNTTGTNTTLAVAMLYMGATVAGLGFTLVGMALTGVLAAGVALAGVAGASLVSAFLAGRAQPALKEEQLSVGMWSLDPPVRSPGHEVTPRPPAQGAAVTPPAQPGPMVPPMVHVSGDTACVSKQDLAREMESLLPAQGDFSATTVALDLTPGTSATQVKGALRVTRQGDAAPRLTRDWVIDRAECPDLPRVVARVAAQHMEAQ